MTPAELLAARKALGLSQKRLADALGLKTNGSRTIRRYEKGDAPIPYLVAREVERLLAEKGNQ